MSARDILCARVKTQFALTMFCAGLNTGAEGQCRLLCVPVGTTGKSNVVDSRSSLRSLLRGYGTTTSVVGKSGKWRRTNFSGRKCVAAQSSSRRPTK